jgi:hypothetical protein
MTYTIDQDFLKPYFTGQKKHKNYLKALDVAFHLQFHFDGFFQRPWMTGTNTSNEPTLKNPYFNRLIDQRRPTESIVVNDYRRTNYTPVTKAPCHKVVTSLKKIVKCKDWKIDYSKTEIPAFLPDEETLERYCEEFYPMDNTITYWTYKSLIRWMLVDPNALCVIMPMDWDVESSELLKPYSFIIECKDVYDYKEGELAIFLSSKKSEYLNDNGTKCEGKIIITVTKDCFYEARQIGQEDFEIVEHPHYCGEMPAFLLGGETKNTDPVQPFYESFLQCMLPSLDDAARDSSDLSSEKVMHIFSTMWYMRTQRCDACSGSGNVLAQGKQTICQTCDGTGALAPSPHRAMEINADNALLQNKNIPIPPAGYIEKSTEMVTLMRSEIQDEIRSALSAINMEFLAEVPLSQSGVAKEVDRDELNNFVGGIAHHVVENIIKNIYWFINEMRYSVVIPNAETRRKMLPKIPVPQDFNFMSQADAEDTLIKLTGSDISGELKDLAEMEFLHMKYADQPEIRNRLICIHNHNPLGAYSSLEVEQMLTSSMVRKIDTILYIYIDSFVTQLLAENTDFMDLDFIKQKDILYELAQAKMEEIAEEMKAEQPATQEPQLDEDGNPIQQMDENGEPIPYTDEEQAIIDANTKQKPNLLENQDEVIKDKKPAGKQRSKERNNLDNS